MRAPPERERLAREPNEGVAKSRAALGEHQNTSQQKAPSALAERWNELEALDPELADIVAVIRYVRHSQNLMMGPRGVIHAADKDVCFAAERLQDETYRRLKATLGPHRGRLATRDLVAPGGEIKWADAVQAAGEEEEAAAARRAEDLASGRGYLYEREALTCAGLDFEAIRIGEEPRALPRRP